MRIGILPLAVKPLKIAENLDALRNRLMQARSMNIDMVVLPEMSLTGYIFEPHELDDFAISIDEASEFWSRVASETGIALVAGFAEKKNKSFFSSGLLVDKDGQIVGYHRKINEMPPFSTGTDVSAFEFNGLMTAIILCGDLFDDGVVGRVRRLELDLLLIPIYRCFDMRNPDPERWEKEEKWAYVRAAAGLADYVFISNALDKWEKSAFGGGLIVNKEGSILAESPHWSDKIAFVDL